MTNETQKQQTIEERLEEGISKYSAQVASQLPTQAERRLDAYERLMGNRRKVFETTDTQNGIGLLPRNNDYCLLMGFDDAERRAVTREEFIKSVRERLTVYEKRGYNPEVIAEYKVYLEEDRKTPYNSSNRRSILYCLKNFILGGTN